MSQLSQVSLVLLVIEVSRSYSARHTTL